MYCWAGCRIKYHMANQLVINKKQKSLDYLAKVFNARHKVNSVDVLVASVPLTVTQSPLMAGAVLKSIAERANHSCLVMDFNIAAVSWLEHHLYKSQLMDFFTNNVLHECCAIDVEFFVEFMADQICARNPKILGLSVFTTYSRACTLRVCQAIKTRRPDIKIIIGGAGIAVGGAGTVDFGEKLKKDQIIDDYISGDAEISFYQYLKGNTQSTGINSSEWNNLDFADLEAIPYPNYDDYIWSLYPVPMLLIIGSRGCVRQCKFCDYIERWKKFVWREADDILAEMLWQQEKYGVSLFEFTDAVINGNMKEYRQFVQKLAQHNETCDADKRIRWGGYFIMRSQTQFKEEIWEMTAKSGGTWMAIGIETFDDKIRAEIGKPFTNDDIDFGLSMIQKYNMHGYLLFIVGHINETYEHVLAAKQWMNQRLRFKDHITISLVSTLGIPQDTWYDRHQKEIGITWIKPMKDLHASTALADSDQHWANPTTGSTYELRSQWLLELLDHAKMLGYNVVDESRIHSVFDDMQKS